MPRKKPISAAERQARFRARHLGVGGERARLNMIVSATTAAKLKRLARHHGVTQVQALERALADAEAAAVKGVKDTRAYYATTDVTQ